MIAALIAFFEVLPELLKLIKAVQANMDKSADERKLKDDIKKINEAFENKDPDALRDIFNS